MTERARRKGEQSLNLIGKGYRYLRHTADILGSLRFLRLLKSRIYRITKEIRDRWPLLTVENEVNGDPKRTNERGPFLIGSLHGLVLPVQGIIVLPWLL
jgi:hypothetical protein